MTALPQIIDETITTIEFPIREAAVKTLTEDTFRELKTYFYEVDSSDASKLGEISDFGIWSPSSLNHVYNALKHLINDGLIDSSLHYFIDTGCGDGRINILARMFGFQSIGIEGDSKMALNANRTISDVVSLGLIDGSGIRVIEGDFLVEGMYTREDLDLSEPGIFFNYFTMAHELAPMIKKHAAPGTKLLYYNNGLRLPPEHIPLRLEATLEKNIVQPNKIDDEVIMRKSYAQDVKTVFQLFTN